MIIAIANIWTHIMVNPVQKNRPSPYFAGLWTYGPSASKPLFSSSLKPLKASLVSSAIELQQNGRQSTIWKKTRLVNFQSQFLLLRFLFFFCCVISSCKGMKRRPEQNSSKKYQNVKKNRRNSREQKLNRSPSPGNTFKL